MPHRSNQAVASQDQAAPQAAPDPPPRRRFLIGWATALAALGLSTAALAMGLWLVRFSIAELLIGAALSERGADADFQITALDLNSAEISGIVFGDPTAPDAAISAIEVRWQWRGLSPRVTALRVVEPRLNVRLDQQGRVSAGTLDHLRGRPSARRPALPALRLDIVSGQARILAPFGPIEATFQGQGNLGRDFSATAHVQNTTRAAGAFALQNGRAELVLVSREDSIAFRLNADLAALQWNESRVEGGAIRVMGRAPLDLSRYDIEAAWRADVVRAPRLSATTLSGAVGIEALAREDGLEPATWESQAHLNALQLVLAGNDVRHARLQAHARGDDRQGRGAWTLGAEQFIGLAMISQAPSASGAFAIVFGAAPSVTADARVLLPQARLDERAQQRIRSAFPNVPAAPIGPTFAQAEHALDEAADRFDLVAPLNFRANGGDAALTIAAPIEARAATGLTMRLAPLRQDAPALSLQLPGLGLLGAVRVDMRGGGAPDATLLLDRVAWAPNAAFEADGTIGVENWRTENSSISASELSLGLHIPPGENGQLDLRGPVRITGPIGDGDVRNLVAGLDLSVHWGNGWRVIPNRGCVPMQLAQLNVAGLSFSEGNLALCPLDGALIAADAQERLSGGFSIEGMSLSGRMAGPDAQPARLGARRVAANFRGVQDNILVAIRAETPTLAIEMGEQRALQVALRALTADAHIADSWRIEGAFDQGTLTDPTLPGSVAALAGTWSAGPENDKPVIRVTAAEAQLTANRSGEDQRPLFRDLHLVEVDALLRDGRLDVAGAVLLQATAQRLARFEAHHDISDGVGGADIRSADLVFDEHLQPEEISEMALGLVANVNGPASLDAGIVWDREAISATGRLTLNGVSMSTATMPVIENVRGAINFDDLFALTTPPGQEVSIALLNPGVAVRNGRVRFQLLSGERVNVEDASFEFAGGVLSMAPTTIALGADETNIVLALRDVDAASLIANLNVPQLEASGRVEGTFPLYLTSRSAFIRGGVLRAQPGGGIIAYTGEAGANATGPARVAFDALRRFRYDDLSLTLDGDLSGDVVSSINFSGQNAGRSVDLGPIAPIPGVGDVRVRGVPFDFNVTVTAPFRRLAEAAATFSDPGALLDRARNEEANEAVDQEAVEPR